jgi:hypothetical protein
MSRAKSLIEQAITYKSPEAIAKANNAIMLTGNPPSGGEIVRQFAITPTGKDFFSEDAWDIGHAYDDLPMIQTGTDAVQLWEKLGRLCVEQAAALGKDYQIIRYDDRDPYVSSDEMLADIAKGIYKVTSLHSTHPVWNPDTNVAFRIAHDIQGHGSSHGAFSLRGEVLAYQGQCENTPEELWSPLFTEIIGQTSSLCIHHFFGPQKVGLIMLSQQEIDMRVNKALSKGLYGGT